MFLKSDKPDVADLAGVNHIQENDAGSSGDAGKETTR
jgi:hypothetical protein